MTNEYLDELEDLSDNFTGVIDDYEDDDEHDFDGDDEDDDYDNDYIGYDPRKKQTTIAKTEKYAFKITNRTGEDQNVALTDAGLDTMRIQNPFSDGASGLLVDYVGGKTVASTATAKAKILYDDPTEIQKLVPDVTAKLSQGIFYATAAADMSTKAGTIEGTEKGMTLRHFQKFINKNPAEVKSIFIDVNDKAVFGGQLIIKPVSPFSRTGEEIIQLADFVSPKNFNDKKIIIEPRKHLGFNLQLDGETLVILNIPGTANGSAFTEATVQFNLGKIYNSSERALRVQQPRRAKRRK